MESESSDDESWSVRDQLHLLVNATADYAIFALNTDGTIASWNVGAEQIKGYTAEQIIGQHFSIFYPPEALDRDLPARELEIAASAGVYHEEGWRVRRDGTLFWASVTITALRDETGRLRGFGKVSRDLTERKAQEEQLRRAEEQFRMAFDAAATGMALVSLDGRWLRVNDALCITVQRTFSELAALSVAEVLGLDPAEPPSEWFVPLLASPSPRADLTIIRPDGTAVWVQVKASMLAGVTAESAQLIVHVEDVTTRTLTAQRLQQAEQAKSRFVATTSHELRTPLTSIRGYAELLTRRWDSLADEQRQSSVDLIARQARRLQALVEDLLTISALDADGPKLAPTDINVKQFIDDLARDLDVAIDTRVSPTAVVRADPLRLTQIVANLITNSQKHGRPPIVVEADDNDTRTRITVEDHGDGVPAEFIPTMFDRFTQADDGIDRRSDGTGLGLSICQALVEAHGGGLSYEPNPGGGARFVVSLPRP